jgi:AcrR family transcriptional regulator
MKANDVTPKLTRKGQATRERIVAAASTLTFQQGVAGTSTEDVQQAAGVSASQLYHYFSDKRALIRAVIAYQTEAVIAAQQPYLSQLDSLEALKAWRDHVVGLQQKRKFQGGCPLGTLSCELAEIWPEARVDLAHSFGEWEAAIQRGLQAMYDRGELRGDADPERLALGMLAAVQGGLLLNQARRDTAALEAVLDAVLANIMSLTTPS